MHHSYMRGILLLALALILGFALMGFEMLGSRYLYPYFGGGINTWASLIATVLVALMLGYLIGGALVLGELGKRLNPHWLSRAVLGSSAPLPPLSTPVQQALIRHTAFGPTATADGRA